MHGIGTRGITSVGWEPEVIVLIFVHFNGSCGHDRLAVLFLVPGVGAVEYRTGVCGVSPVSTLASAT